MMTLTLLDVTSILGLSSVGKEVHSYVNYPTADLGYVFNGAFSTLLEQNAKISGDVSNVEHPTFLMYFFSKYFYGTSSIVVIQEL